jgi:hypothetical protein
VKAAMAVRKAATKSWRGKEEQPRRRIDVILYESAALKDGFMKAILSWESVFVLRKVPGRKTSRRKMLRDAPA